MTWTFIIQLCQGKYSFPFYGTFKVCKISIVNVQFCTYFQLKKMFNLPKNIPVCKKISYLRFICLNCRWGGEDGPSTPWVLTRRNVPAFCARQHGQYGFLTQSTDWYMYLRLSILTVMIMPITNFKCTLLKKLSNCFNDTNQRDHAPADRVSIVLKDVDGCYTIIGQEDLYVSLYVINILYMV